MLASRVLSDFELLEAWRSGDARAGSELFGRHFQGVYQFFRSKVEPVAEDLTQQTFLHCAKSRDDFRGSASFRTYLFVIARNQLYMYLREHARSGTTVDFETVSLEDLSIRASSLLVVREEHKLLVHALRRLPLELQIALELYYVQRLRGRELVEALGLRPGTVRSRIRRAMEQLRERIAELAGSPQRIRTTLTDLARWAEDVRLQPTPEPSKPRR